MENGAAGDLGDPVAIISKSLTFSTKIYIKAFLGMERALAQGPDLAFVTILCLLMEEQTAWAVLKHQRSVPRSGC